VKTKLSYIKIGSKVIVETSPAIATDTLASGIYKLFYDGMKDILLFDEVTFKNDKILSLPSKEYMTIINQMELFMSDETRKKFDDLDFLYKRGVLLYGPPGSGKTILVNRIVEHAVTKNKAICLFVDNISALKKAYEHLNQSQPDQLLVVVFEEFDRLAQEDEEDLLLLLDGQIQRNNVIFLATTNYFEEIPKRLVRPGRMSSVVCVTYPSRDVRYSYFKQKLGEKFKDLDLWSDRTEGLTVDELKEIIQAVFILNEDLEETIERLLNTRVEAPPKDDDDYNGNNFSYKKIGRRRR
jgi:SpoVK/Ycf46/Vps4 family AAA+-type ATPase